MEGSVMKCRKTKHRVHWREPLNEREISPVRDRTREKNLLISTAPKGFMASVFSGCKKVHVSEMSIVSRKTQQPREYPVLQHGHRRMGKENRLITVKAVFQVNEW
ncbi:hypothetical protein SUGI_0478600 [Cryptomeria japonica]|nr:hypothetical protein SUGI_0478600 [Cryptomeria japonica]